MFGELVGGVTTLTLTMAVVSGLLWFVALLSFLLRWVFRLRLRYYSPVDGYAVLIKFKVASESFEPFPKGRYLSYSGDWILWEEDDGLVAICVKNWFVT